VLGHSEGSLIGVVAAQRMGAHAFVSIAGAGRPLQQIILEQVKSQLPPDLLKPTQVILKQLVAGRRVESVPTALNVIFRQSAPEGSSRPLTLGYSANSMINSPRAILTRNGFYKIILR